ncbi:serine/threonine protein kinase [Glycomyces rhizosphaerae]|uniref:non-specific serine/threonine protein kinase n=1 Tax=Glycomyces rhizosphaerae TaxID=2054422 RepID=A0ABV7Q3V9_9ACTN
MDSGTLIAGRYRLDHVIASGGMGAVWRAEDERLDRTVAVKVLHAGLERAGRPQERFKVEAKILASLKGPGCVEVYDFGEELDGDRTVLFLVMELVEGVSLAELLHREERLDPERTMRIMAEAAEALATAHKRGVVHRDIKPGNILIDTDGRVKVVDFGISLFAHNERLTPSGEVLGTAPYVSPEQLRDKDVSGASDLYALGAVAYECLAGTPPFDAVDPAAVIHGHLYSEPPALPADVPSEVAEVVTKSLKKTPEERWESGEILAAAARAANTGAFPVTTGPGRHRQSTTPSTPAGSSSEAATVDVSMAAKPPYRAPSEPPVTPPSQPAVIEPADEGPRRRRRSAFVIAAVAAVLAVFAVVAWSPWSGDGPDSDAADEGGTTPAVEATPSTESTTAASPEAAESPAETAAAEESTAEDGGNEGGGGDGGESDNGEDTSDSDAAKEGSGTVPPVTGMTTFEARDYLNEQGFSNVVAESGMYAYWPEPEHCEVMGHTPTEGETIDYQDRITLSYHYRDSVGTTCEW